MKKISKIEDFSLLTNKELIDIKTNICNQLELFDMRESLNKNL